MSPSASIPILTYEMSSPFKANWFFKRETAGRPSLTSQGTNGSNPRMCRGLHPASTRQSYWPRMTTELKEYIGKCDVCMAHRSEQSKEQIQHDFVARPWSKVAVDLCDLDGRTFLVISDYYSNYIEVARITSITSRSIIKELKAVFARFGIPEVLVTMTIKLSSPQQSFPSWGFDHVTSSPRYPQSNGKAKNAVKTVKHLFTKCKEAGQSEFLAY